MTGAVPRPVGSTISTAELRRRSPTPTSRSSTSGRSPPTTAGARTASRAAVTSRALSRSRAPGSTSVDDAEIERLLRRRRASSPAERSSSTATARDVARSGQAGRPRPRRASASTSTAGPPGRPTRPCPSSGCRTTSSSSTPTGSAQVLDGGRPEAAPAGQLPPLPRQLRRPRGVRGGPPPGRAVPRHELARGPGRLEPPLAGGARGRPSRARDHARHDGHPLRPRHRGRRRTRSGRAAGPARSPPPARR